MMKLFAVVLVSLLVGSVIFGGIFMDRLADKVIERMEKPYSPSPYGPGMDPDRLDGFRTKLEDHPGKAVKFDEEEWLNRWEQSRKDVQ